MPIELVIGSRSSELAMIQSRHVASLIEKHNPGVAIEIKSKLAMGDIVLDKPLHEIATVGGLFTKDLEVGLKADHYDLIVHSLKDMPTTLPEGLFLAAITAREDPRDVLVIAKKHIGTVLSLKDLIKGSVIGTSSLRRQSILAKKYPHLKAKLDAIDSGFDGIILAAAGLIRLGWNDRITEFLNEKEFPYGVGQGALGIECNHTNRKICENIQCLEDWRSTARCLAERSFLRKLQGGCQVPIGVHSFISNDDHIKIKSLESKMTDTISKLSPILTLYGEVNSIDGSTSVSSEQSIALSMEIEDVEVVPEYKRIAENLGESLANALLKLGAADIIGDMTVERPITYGSAENAGESIETSKSS